MHSLKSNKSCENVFQAIVLIKLQFETNNVAKDKEYMDIAYSTDVARLVSLSV